MNILTRKFILMTSMLCFLVGVIFQENNIMLIAVLFIFSHNILYSVWDFYKRIVFFSFNITFFIFLLGRIVVTTLFNYKTINSGILGLAFKEEKVTIIITACIYLALLGIYAGYTQIQKFDLSFLKVKKELSGNYLASLRIFSLIFFYLCTILRYFNIYEMRNIAELEGYYESFSTFTSSLPPVLSEVSGMFDVAFFVYLSTFPLKRKSYFPILLYLGEGLFSALAGRRSVLILNLLIIFIYYCVRNVRSLEKSESKWLSKFEWIIGLVVFPILIVFMSIIGNKRSNRSTISSTGFFDSILDFFHSQGISANVIGYTEMYKDSIPKDKLYTFGPLFEFVDNNLIRPINGLPQLWGQTKERALEGHLFTHTISFLIMPVLYLKGVGYGSSYIAELYNDFSFIGVFLGSIVYGIILYVLYYILNNSNFILVTFSLIMIRSILFAPRAAVLSFIVSALSLTNIIALLIILIGSKFLHIIVKNKSFTTN